MTQPLTEAFVYCWTDHLANRLYVGSHKGSVDDGYVCSSKLMMEEYNKRPSDFTRQIVAEGTFTDIRVLEAKLLDTINVKHDPDFYNQHNGNGDFYCKGHTVETRKKIGLSSRGNTNTKGRKIHTVESKAAISAHSKNNKAALGSKHTEEWKAQQSERQKGIDISYLHSPENIDKRRISLKGKIPWNKGIETTEETKAKISAAKRGTKHSEETKLKMKNRIPWNKGKSRRNNNVNG